MAGRHPRGACRCWWRRAAQAPPRHGKAWPLWAGRKPDDLDGHRERLDARFLIGAHSSVPKQTEERWRGRCRAEGRWNGWELNCRIP